MRRKLHRARGICAVLAALAAGANLRFADLLPAARAQAFRVVDNRTLLGLDHIHRMAEMSGMFLCL